MFSGRGGLSTYIEGSKAGLVTQIDIFSSTPSHNKGLKSTSTHPQRILFRVIFRFQLLIWPSFFSASQVSVRVSQLSSVIASSSSVFKLKYSRARFARRVGEFALYIRDDALVKIDFALSYVALRGFAGERKEHVSHPTLFPANQTKKKKKLFRNWNLLVFN